MYCLLKAYPIAYDDHSDDNHIYLHLVAKDRDYSAAVNVASNVSYSKLYFCVKELGNSYFDAFDHIFEGENKLFPAIRGSFQSLHALDYWGSGLLQKTEMIHAERVVSPKNELGHLLIALAKETMDEPKSFVIVYGKKWGPKPEKDWIFGFEPAQGIHDIHCNQSSPEHSRWSEKDRPEEDGAIFFCNAKTRKVTGVFTMFK